MQNNPVLTLLNDRYKTRAISDEHIDDATVGELIEAIRLTPSCMNNQPWRYVFAESDDARAKISEAFTGGNVGWAPHAALIVVGYSRAEDDCQIKDGREYHQFDLGMATMNLMMAATHHGLAARPMAGFRPDVIRELYGLDDKDLPLVMVAIGKPGENEDHVPEKYRGNEDKPRTRKDAGEIVRRI
jgi:nitroreductase